MEEASSNQVWRGSAWLEKQTAKGEGVQSLEGYIFRGRLIFRHVRFKINNGERICFWLDP